MKKRIVIPALAVLACLLTACGYECVPQEYYSNMENLKAGFYANDVAASETVATPSEDLRLKIFFDIAKDEFSLINGEPECGWAHNSGLRDGIGSLKLTCDRDVAGIPAGTDLIYTISPKIYMGDYVWTVREWINMVNSGSSDRYGLKITPWVKYEFSLEPLPYYIDVEEGVYRFTFTIDYNFYNTEPTVFNLPPVTLK